MREKDWLCCPHPKAMLAAVMSRGRKKVRPREQAPERLRLFACACVRRLWRVLDDDHRRSLETTETHCRDSEKGGLAQARSLRAEAFNRISAEVYAIAPQAPLADRLHGDALRWAISAVWEIADTNLSSAVDAYQSAARATGYLEWEERSRREEVSEGPPSRDFDSKTELAVQADLLRDIVGNPYRPTAVDPAWLTCDRGTALALARLIDQEQDFTQMPILADALEEYGCTDGNLLGHLHSPGPHVRGCWALDLILGRM